MGEELVIVQVAQGALRGKKSPCRAGGLFYSFKGVPYAKPPVGSLRFKDPQPPVPWGGIRDALKEGSICTQFNLDLKDFIGSEDCLYLNVYAPEWSNIGKGGGPMLPVMMWIHGGGFASGSGTYELYGGDFLAAQGVVVVTINYRLGPFGFLYLGHPAAAGNYGLKDQVAALRWVKKNIAAFGGDPDNVTIFGESAGGASVHFHMLSPMSKGLFHRAIAQSGSVMNPWVSQYEPVETTKRLARVLGCSSDDPEEIIIFLRDVDHMNLIRAANTEAPFPRDKKRIMVFNFVPTPEVVAPDAELFLPAPPKQLIDEGRHHPVPFMTGLTDQEGLLLLFFSDFRKAAIAACLDSSWEENVLPETRLPGCTPHAADAIQELRRFFLGGKPLGPDTLRGYLDMFSDLAFGEGIHYTLKRMAESDKAPLYLYHFILDDELNSLKKMWKLDMPGACHADDFGYIFRLSRVDPDLPEGHSAAVARTRMLRLWTNFAKFGNPTPEQDPLLATHWEPYTSAQRRFLEIGPQLQLSMDLYKERFQFWDNFYATFGQ